MIASRGGQIGGPSVVRGPPGRECIPVFIHRPGPVGSPYPVRRCICRPSRDGGLRLAGPGHPCRPTPLPCRCRSTLARKCHRCGRRGSPVRPRPLPSASWRTAPPGRRDCSWRTENTGTRGGPRGLRLRATRLAPGVAAHVGHIEMRGKPLSVACSGPPRRCWLGDRWRRDQRATQWAIGRADTLLSTICL